MDGAEPDTTRSCCYDFDRVNRTIELRDILNRTPLGAFRFRVVLLCWLIAVLDGFDVQSMAFVAPVLAPLWDIPRAVMGQVLTAGLAGFLAGSLIAGRQCDRFGRRPVLLCSVILVGLSSMLTALAGDITQLMLTRALTGLGLGGVTVSSLALTAEYAPDKSRATVITAMYVGFPIGGSLAGMIAAPLIQAFGWQSIFWVGGFGPLLLILVVWRLLPESPRFSVIAGQDPQRIGAVLNRIAPDYVYQPGDRFAVEEQSAVRASLAELFTPGRRVGTGLLWLTCFASLLVLYLLLNWLPSILRQSGASLEAANHGAVMFNLGGIIGALALSRVVDRFGAPRTLTITYLLGALAVFLLPRADATTVALGLTVLMGIGVMGSQFCVTAVATVFYPTAIRSTGVGSALGVGRIGSLAGPMIGGVALGAGVAPTAIFSALALPMLVCAVAVALLSIAMPRA